MQPQLQDNLSSRSQHFSCRAALGQQSEASTPAARSFHSLVQGSAPFRPDWSPSVISFLELDQAQSSSTSGSNNQQPLPDQKEAESSGASFLEFPARDRASDVSQPAQPSAPAPPKLMRVRLSVHYRVHSRQMLCIGGSQIPFGWSFLSISKLPMIWNEGDVWTAEVRWRPASRPSSFGSLEHFRSLT